MNDSFRQLHLTLQMAAGLLRIQTSTTGFVSRFDPTQEYSKTRIQSFTITEEPWD